MLLLFLLSGGGSALLEKPLIPGAELRDITSRWLASGGYCGDEHPSASACPASRAGGSRWPAPLRRCPQASCSDILGDPLDMIASGRLPDSSTCAEAKAIAARYGLKAFPGSCGAWSRKRSQSAGQCDHQNHRQRAGTMRRYSGFLPQSGHHPLR